MDMDLIPNTLHIPDAVALRVWQNVFSQTYFASFLISSVWDRTTVLLWPGCLRPCSTAYRFMIGSLCHGHRHKMKLNGFSNQIQLTQSQSYALCISRMAHAWANPRYWKRKPAFTQFISKLQFPWKEITFIVETVSRISFDLVWEIHIAWTHTLL